MAPPDFRELNNQPATQYSKPKALPPGTYFGTITGREWRKVDYKQGKGEQDVLRLPVRFTGAGDDVDAAELQTALNGRKLENIQNRVDLTYDEAEEYKIWELAKSCGIDLASVTKGQAIEQLVNKRVMFTLIQKPNKEGDELFNNIRGIKGAE